MQHLTGHYTYGKLIRFIFPSIIMQIIMSVYGIVDGLFVSNFVGKTAFAAVNFILPFLMLMGCMGFMFGSGGGALISKTMGERRMELANGYFSLVVYVSLAVSVVLCGIGYLVLRPVAVVLGAEGQLLEDSLLYGRVYLLGVPASLLQYEFQYLFSTAGKPRLGLRITLAAGISNVLLDALFVGVCSWGLVGAAAATVASQIVGGFLPLAYFFSRKNNSLLHLGKTRFNGWAVLQTCRNGAAGMLTSISWAVVGMLYNVQLLRYSGEDGVAAYGVIMYVCMIFLGFFIGYTVGCEPIVGFQYGAENNAELRNVLRKSLVLVGGSSVLMTLFSTFAADPLCRIFVGYDPELLEMTKHGFILYGFSYLFAGIATLGSSFFTALNDGKTAATISLLRTMVFQILSVLLLPVVFGLDGIWSATTAAEALSLVLVVWYLVKKQKIYHY